MKIKVDMNNKEDVFYGIGVGPGCKETGWGNRTPRRYEDSLIIHFLLHILDSRTSWLHETSYH